MLIGEILNKLNKVKKQHDGSFLALCPAHDDRNPSLHISQAEEKILLKCQAGCNTDAVCQSLGITLADLFTETKETPKTIVATYDYQDEQRTLLFQVVRYIPKSFSQRHKNGSGEWVWNMDGVRKVLYHLPEILTEEGTIYLTEGERDADKLWEYGQVATTSPGGANAWKPEYANYLKGKRVVIIPDNDSAGMAYAKAAALSLKGKAREIRCLILPNKDFTDWVEAGGDVALLPSLEQDISALFSPIRYEQDNEAIIWRKNISEQIITFKAETIRQEKTGIHARISILQDYSTLAWSYMNFEKSEERIRLANQAKIKDYSKEEIRSDLDLFCVGLWDFHLSNFIPELMAGEESDKPPTFCLYPYILESGGSILFAPPGRGKSFTALLWAVCIDAGISSIWKVSQKPVLYINLERSAQSTRRRLANINLLLGLPATRFLLTINARGKSLADIAPAIRKGIQQHEIKVVILDSISRAGFDLTENKPINAIIDTLSGLSETWLALGHTPRASDEHIYGGIMFDAGADIVIQLRSQISDNKLGIGYEITKANDLPQFGQKVYCFEFEDWKLKAVRPAKPFEFPDIEAKAKTNMLDDIIDFVSNQDNGDATTTQIEQALGFNRVNISKILNQSGRFVKTKKDGRNQYFGVMENV